MGFGERLTRRHVLRRHPAEADVARFVQAQDWDIVSRTRADREIGVDYQVVWLTPTTLTLHYVEDQVARHSYVFIEGDDFDTYPTYEDALVEALSPWTLDELAEAVENTSNGPDRGLAILRAGMGAPMQFASRFFELIAIAMGHPDFQMRNIGVLACTYSPWPQYRPLLYRIAANDPEGETRDMAQSALRAFDRLGVPEP